MAAIVSLASAGHTAPPDDQTNGTPSPDHNIVCAYTAEPPTLVLTSPRKVRAKAIWACSPSAPELHDVCVTLVWNSEADPDEWPPLAGPLCTDTATTTASGSIQVTGTCISGTRHYATYLEWYGFHGNWDSGWEFSDIRTYTC